jgi:hypothetical protein
MKKLLLTFALILSVNLLINAQTPSPTPFDYKDGVVQKYDKFQDETSLSLKLSIEGGLIPFEGITFIIATVYTGEKPPADNALMVSMTAVNKYSDYKYSHSLTFLLDDVRLKLGDGIYSTKSVENGILSKQYMEMESAVYIIQQSDLEKIIDAKKIEAQFGTKQFTFKPHQLIYLKEFYYKLIPQK